MAKPADWPVERFRALVNRILEETGLKQAALAALVPMDQSQLSRWKSGSSRPKFDNLVALGTVIQNAYPALRIGPNEVLESAGYAPPDTLPEPEPRPPGTTPGLAESLGILRRAIEAAEGTLSPDELEEYWKGLRAIEEQLLFGIRQKQREYEQQPQEPRATGT